MQDPTRGIRPLIFKGALVMPVLEIVSLIMLAAGYTMLTLVEFGHLISGAQH